MILDWLRRKCKWTRHIYVFAVSKELAQSWPQLFMSHGFAVNRRAGWAMNAQRFTSGNMPWGTIEKSDRYAHLGAMHEDQENATLHRLARPGYYLRVFTLEIDTIEELGIHDLLADQGALLVQQVRGEQKVLG